MGGGADPRARAPIDALVRDSTTDAATRAKLELVLAARAFASDSVKLNAKRGFTTYSRIDRDTLVVVLSAAYRDKLRYKTWWFPIVGSVPYKGYFDVRDAKRAAAELSRDGFDAYLRPASAFSTLGYLEDPVLSTTIDEDSVELVNTVIHELTHNTFYASGQAVFNESFANFVGTHGAEWFYAARGDSAKTQVARDDWARQKLLGRFWSAVYNSVDSAFKAHADSKEERLRAREIVFAAARERFAREIEPALPGYDPKKPVVLHLDNAALMSRRMYRTGLDDFDAIYEREGRAAAGGDRAHHHDREGTPEGSVRGDARVRRVRERRSAHEVGRAGRAAYRAAAPARGWAPAPDTRPCGACARARPRR